MTKTEADHEEEAQLEKAATEESDKSKERTKDEEEEADGHDVEAQPEMKADTPTLDSKEKTEWAEAEEAEPSKKTENPTKASKETPSKEVDHDEEAQVEQPDSTDDFKKTSATKPAAESNEEIEATWEKMAKEYSAKADEEAQQVAVVEEELHPKRRKIHKLFFFISIAAMLAAIAMVAGQVLGLVFKDVGIIQWVLRAYVIGLSIVVLFTETEMSKLARENIILHNWICRGLIYSFIGVIGLEEIESAEFKKDPPRGVVTADYFIKAVTWIMVGIGCMYFIMGIACFQRRYEQERLDYTERCAQAVIARRDRRLKEKEEKATKKA